MKARLVKYFWLVFHVAASGSLIFIVPHAECGGDSQDTKESKHYPVGQPEIFNIFDLAIHNSTAIGAGWGFNFFSLELDNEKRKSEFSEKKHFWRAFLETSVLMGAVHLYYKKTHTRWIEGIHKYHSTWKDQKERIFNRKNWNYDANCFRLNWMHALSGGLYYNFSRTNNLSVLESLLMSWAGSSYWEFIVEYRSDISINDHIITPLGGLSIGEAWFQLGKYFADRSDRLSQVLSFLNPILKMNRFFDQRRMREIQPETLPGWHEFNIDLGLRNIRIRNDDYNRTALYTKLHTQIINIPEYGHQGLENRLVKSPLFSEIKMDVNGVGRRFEEFNLFSRVVWFGFFKQNIDTLDRGYSLYLGAGSAYSVFKKKRGTTNFPCSFKGRVPEDLKLDEPRDFTDKLATAHIIGPVFDWTTFMKNLNVRLVMDMYVDFGITHSFAFNAYSRQYDFSGVKTPLLVNGYYYGWGTTLSSGLYASLRNVNFQVDLRYQSYASIEGRDRFQHLLTNDFHLNDSRFVSRFAVGYRIPGLPLGLKASYEGIYRRGRIEDIEETRWEVRGFLGLSLVY